MNKKEKMWREILADPDKIEISFNNIGYVKIKTIHKKKEIILYQCNYARKITKQNNNK